METDRAEKLRMLIMSYRHTIWRQCYHYANENKDLAKDLTQEVFVAVCADIDKLRADVPSHKAHRWINYITRRTLRQKYKKIKTLQSVYVGEIVDVGYYDKKIEGDLLEDMVEYLTDDDRMLIKEKLFGYTNSEIAQHIGSNAHAVSERIRKIKLKLKIIFNTKYHGKY